MAISQHEVKKQLHIKVERENFCSASGKNCRGESSVNHGLGIYAPCTHQVKRFKNLLACYPIEKDWNLPSSYRTGRGSMDRPIDMSGQTCRPKSMSIQTLLEATLTSTIIVTEESKR